MSGAGAPSLASFDAWAKREPGRIAIVRADAEATTYGQLRDVASGIARAIAATASRSCPCVGVLSEDAATLAASLLGALKADAIFVVLNLARNADNHTVTVAVGASCVATAMAT